jgi:hypothetical protein
MAANPVTLDFSKAVPVSGSQNTSSPGVSLDFNQAQHLDQTTEPPTEQQRYQAATEEGSLWRKVLGMNPDGETLRKHGFDTDSYNAAERKYKEVSAGEVARGADFNPQTQKLYNAGEHNSVIRGAEKGVAGTLSGTSQLAGKALDKVGLRQTENGQSLGIFGEAPATDAETKPEGIGEHVGYIGENLTEFVLGDEALKSLSLAQKLGLATKIAKLAESHPVVAKLVSAGLRATRTGTVSGAQEAAHGGDTGDVLTAAGTGFVSSAASEGFGALAKLAKPGAKEIAGETLQTVPKWKGAGTAAKVAAANQDASQRVVGNVARDSADAITQKFGKQAPDTITSFRDAAQAVQSAAQPVFKTLDKLSDGEFQIARNEMDKASKVMRRATSMTDMAEAEKAYNTASSKIDKIFEDAKGAVSADDLQNAKGAWRSMKTLEKLHAKIDAAYTSPQSAAELSGSARTLQLQKLQGRLNAAFSSIPKADLDTVLGKEGAKSLYDLAALGADPLKAKSLSDVATAIGEHLGIGGAGLAVGALAGHAVPGGSAALGIHFLYAHPEVGQIVVKGLSKGLTPKVIVPTVLQLLDSQRREQTQ